MAPAVDPARRVAYDVVHAVDVDDAYANLLLGRLRRERRLSPRDSAFSAELTYGTLRWQGVLDAVIASCARRPVDDLDAAVRATVRLGAYQLLHMRTPVHAAVHATVELARAVAGPKPVGFVNAVLRKVSQADWAGWCERLAPDDELGRLAFRYGQPRWVAAEIAAALGDAHGELEQALAEDRPVTHLVARPGRVTRDELLAHAGPGAVSGPWSPYAVRLDDGGDPATISAVRTGAAGVQDEGSQVVAIALARAGLDGGGTERWLDACAGPGGKTALLQGLVPAGGLVVGAELRPHRANLVARAVRGWAGADVVVADATRPAWPDASFDRVLVDAPCSGLGALRRRPEVRWRRTPEDLQRLRPLQESLLESAVRSVRPGGVVAYVTCSPVLSETSEVVTAVRQRHPELTPVDPRPLLPELADAGDGTHLQLWPHRHGTDAMYLCLLRAGVAPFG